MPGTAMVITDGLVVAHVCELDHLGFDIHQQGPTVGIHGSPSADDVHGHRVQAGRASATGFLRRQRTAIPLRAPGRLSTK